MSDDTLRVVYFIGLLLASAARAAHARRGQRRAARRQLVALGDVLILSLGGLAFALPAVRHCSSWLDFADYALPHWAGPVGIMMYAPTLWLLWRSYADLGQNWRPTLGIRDGHELVTSGVYSRVRHPLYAAHALWGIVQMLLVQNWIAGPALLLTMLIVIVGRIPAEEGQMLEHFGDEYRTYMARTGRLLPPVYLKGR